MSKHEEPAVGVVRTVRVYDWPYDRFLTIKEFQRRQLLHLP